MPHNLRDHSVLSHDVRERAPKSITHIVPTVGATLGLWSHSLALPERPHDVTKTVKTVSACTDSLSDRRGLQQAFQRSPRGCLRGRQLRARLSGKTVSVYEGLTNIPLHPEWENEGVAQLLDAHVRIPSSMQWRHNRRPCSDLDDPQTQHFIVRSNLAFPRRVGFAD